MRTWSLVCSLGIILVSFLPHLPSALFCLPLLLIALWASVQRKFILLTPLSLGIFWGISYGYYAASDWLSDEYHGRDLLVRGVVSGLPAVTDKGVRFEFLVDSISDLSKGEGNQTLPRLRVQKIILNWYNRYEMSPGESWQFTVRLKRPRGGVNPGGFDYQNWLMQNSIDAQGFVREGNANHRWQHGNDGYALRTFIDRVRFKIVGRLRDILHDHPQQALITALVIGESHEITDHQWLVLQNTGTLHLIVISGLHITMFAALFYWIGRNILRFTTTPLRYFSAQQFAAFLAVFGAVAYSALAGFSLPTQRSMIMVATIMLSQIFARNISLNSSLCFSFLLVLLYDPLAAYSKGFWLSFGAVAILSYGLSGRILVSRWKQFFSEQAAIFIGMAPLLIYLIHNFSLMAPLANLIAIPWVSFFVVPVALIGTCNLLVDDRIATWFLSLAADAMAILWQLLEKLMEIFANSQWQANTPIELWTIVLAICGVIWILVPRGYPGRLIGVILLLPLLFPKSQALKSGDYQITVLDVGQGLSVVVQTAEHLMIFDSGPRYNAKSDAGRGIVLPYLASIGKHRLDLLVVSHGDNDHAGGARSIVQATKPLSVASGEVPRVSHMTETTVEPCIEGHSWLWDGVKFEFLHPEQADPKLSAKSTEIKSNNKSCVLRIANPLLTTLLTGDIESVVEHKLVAEHRADLDSDLLIAPHHGSKTSSSNEFIQAVSPDYVVYSAGYQNSFHHPHPKVTARYKKNGVTEYNTALQGALTFISTEGEKFPLIQRQRIEASRYWYWL